MKIMSASIQTFAMSGAFPRCTFISVIRRMNMPWPAMPWKRPPRCATAQVFNCSPNTAPWFSRRKHSRAGTCRMGADKRTSVLNSFNQSHDCPNLFVVDGSSFVSGGAQNPTLTILALALRASEYLAEQKKKGAL